MDIEWSDRIIQHSPSKFSQLCLSASKGKSMAALFCKVAGLTALASVIMLLIAMEVVLTSLLSQHPNCFNSFNASAERS